MTSSIMIREGTEKAKSITRHVSDSITETLSLLLFRNRLALAVKLVLPVAILAGLFILPLVFVFRISFWEIESGRLVPAFTLKNYTYFLSEPVYQRAILQSIQLALTVTGVCLLLAYPLALILTRARLRFASIVTLILISPLFVSVVIRAFGWLVLFERQGLINAVLMGLGLIQEPLELLNSMFGVSIGLINVLLVFMVISILTALVGIPRSLDEAARTLGANPIRAWWHVTWPLSAPGVLAGFVLVFAMAISTYVQPRILGGARFLVVPIQIWREISGVLDWPLGSAMGFVLLSISFLLSLLISFLYLVAFPHVKNTGTRER